MAILIGTSIGIVIGFSVYHYFFMDKLQERVDGMLHNEVNIVALTKAVEKLQNDVEKLKDKQRDFANGS